jgi:hypothetical protein
VLFKVTALLASCTQHPGLHESSGFKVFADRVEQGTFVAQAISPVEIQSNYKSPTATKQNSRTSWKLTQDLSEYPKFQSKQTLLDALYNLSLEEVIENIGKEEHFSTGPHLKDIGTRDISYSILLALAITHPEISKANLMKKVNNGRIVQDTGTGGSWPVSSDRMTWSIAAWEIYKITGDKDWLKTAYKFIKRSMDEDLNVIWDYKKHLFRGESSFLNWREHSYPRWMEPIDIFNSINLSSQAIHFQSLKILTAMGRLLGHEVEKYDHIAKALQKSINKQLWLPEKAYYSQFLYGRDYLHKSEKSETLGEAFTILFDIAPRDRQKMIVANTPVLKYGIPCFYPQIPDVPPYHNDAIWPLVQAYWNWASAKTGNDKAVSHGLAAIMRPAALFLTNKENMVASTGDFDGTVTNSNGQLGSVAGMLSSVYRVIMGMNFEPEGLRFAPLIPKTYSGAHSLTNFKYRKAILNIEIVGFGNQIQRFYLDGKKNSSHIIPSDTEGVHHIRIELNNSFSKENRINLVKNRYTPETPVIQKVANQLVWRATHKNDKYLIYRNGQQIATTNQPRFDNIETETHAEYQVQSINKTKGLSFLSKPVRFVGENYQKSIEAEYYAPHSHFKSSNYSGYGFLMLSKRQNRNIDFGVRVPENGKYRVEFKYANGSGPINNDNKCCVRTLWVNRIYRGAVIFPQRGDNTWDEWGYSNSIEVELKQGYNRLTLSFEEFNENMNGKVNRTLLDHILVTRMEPYLQPLISQK